MARFYRCLIKASVSLIWWFGALNVFGGLLFGDRIGADGTIMPGAPAWVGWLAVAGALGGWAALSFTFDRLLLSKKDELGKPGV